MKTLTETIQEKIDITSGRLTVAIDFDNTTNIIKYKNQIAILKSCLDEYNNQKDTEEEL